jgi:threonyl-tRNA synthetase
MINVRFPDGAIRNYEIGVTPMAIAKSISEGLAKKVIAASVNGVVCDASTPLKTDVSLKLHTWEDSEAKSTFWHSSAHLLAEAVEATFPGVKFWVGPAVDRGFYYDMDLGERHLVEDDLVSLEKKMVELASKNNVFVKKEISKTDAIAYFTEKGDEYKLDLLSGLNDGEITFYTQGDFTDLCRGPHIPHTGLIKAIKLTSDRKSSCRERVYA